MEAKPASSIERRSTPCISAPSAAALGLTSRRTASRVAMGAPLFGPNLPGDETGYNRGMEQCDVLVLGLGAMGSAAAYQLAKRGVKVVGVDRFGPPHDFGSSHGDSRITR